MKISAMIAVAVLAGAFAHADEKMGIAERGVTICFETRATPEAGLAQVIAGKMFANIGIKTVWKEEHTCPATGSGMIHITLVTKRSRTHFRPGVLAFALPFEGVHINVFVDRLRKMVDPNNMPSFLAHVLAHEITHILQGTNEHSDEGVMKANWSPKDIADMRFKPLDFTAKDISMIKLGLEAWALRTAGPSPQLAHK
jgi:hypothetical protein